MIRDPLYRAILQRLDDALDDKEFELFAVDFVRQEFPSAVPVLGGADPLHGQTWPVRCATIVSVFQAQTSRF